MLKFLLSRTMPRDRLVKLDLPRMIFADDGVEALRMRYARRLGGRDHAKRRRSAGHHREIVHRRDRQCGRGQEARRTRE